LENGGNLEEAIKVAQELGAAEADPSHDLDGHDTANKLFIIMKCFTDFSGSIHDISTDGIQNISQNEIIKAKDKDCKIKLVAKAERVGENWKLEVEPQELEMNSFLGSCNGWEMGLEIETDLYERISLKNYEADPVGTSAAVLRDAIDVSI